ncbi:MAG TPA: SDR family oxidoreductase [Candidatus Limnocylindrales bacterium]|nr:SDR family oxidoreductase [Candidatus Limnocylindrales bacterium]
MSESSGRPVALVTGVGRTVGIGAAIAARLAGDGWDIGFTYWSPYDERMPWGRDKDEHDRIVAGIRTQGAQCISIEADLEDVATPEAIFNRLDRAPTALIMAHCESVNSGLLDTTVESFDRHFAVNARATWLLIKEFAQRYQGKPGQGRIIALTSDATIGNLPYGASKGALDRITIAAAQELKHLGITANAINPGPTDTGWMDDDLQAHIIAATPLGRLGTPQDCANLVAFLCSPAGGWVNGQLLHSDGGI